MSLILLVEDSEDDVFFMRRALKTAGLRHSLEVVMDGQAAIDYLDRKGSFADRSAHPEPSLVLLDLRLPQVPGLDVLRWIRTQPRFDTLPVVVLTSSNQESDLQSAYRLRANSFLVKPSDTADLVGLAKTVCEYWLNLNQVPRSPASAGPAPLFQPMPVATP